MMPPPGFPPPELVAAYMAGAAAATGGGVGAGFPGFPGFPGGQAPKFLGGSSMAGAGEAPGKKFIKRDPDRDTVWKHDMFEGKPAPARRAPKTVLTASGLVRAGTVRAAKTVSTTL